MRMEEVSFIRSWSLLTSIALRNHHTPERTLVGVHQGDVAQACKSGLSRDPFTLLSGCQEGSRVQLRRSTPVACGDGSAPVVLAKLNRPLDIRRSRADTGQYASCSDRHRIRSSRVPEIQKGLIEAVGGPAPPLPHSQVSLGSVDVKSTSTVQSSTVASATGPDSSVLVAVLISVGNSNHLVPLRTSQIVCAIEWIGSSRYRRVLFPALTSTSP